MPYNSTIKKRLCKCGCGKPPSMGYNGFRYSCAPEEIKLKVGTKNQVAKKIKNKRLSISREAHKIQRSVDQDKIDLENFFLIKRHEMVGRCVCGCGEKSEKHLDKYYRYSIAHVLGKAKYPSIATHPLNWVELSFFNGCHSTFDDMGYEHCKNTKPKLWGIVVSKFWSLYECLTNEEKAKLPQVLLDTLQDDKPGKQLFNGRL